MIELINFVQSCGFSTSEIIPDGKIHRFNVDRDDRKESGYYIFFQNYTSKSGQQFYVGLCGSWRTGEEFSYQSQIALTKEDKEIARKKILEAQRKAEEQKLKIHLDTAEECQKKFESLSDGLSDYHNKKSLKNSFGARLQDSLHGNLGFVPMRDMDGKIWSLQILYPDRKMFYPGGKVQGCFHVVGRPVEESETVYVAEGFATAATIHEATGGTVVVAFTAVNLPRVASDLKGRFTDKAFIICGDEDQWTDGNPGRTKAEEAAKKVLGKAVFPVFKDLQAGVRPTDFNDLAILEGLDTVRSQLLGVKKEKAFVVPLGFSGGEYYFTSSDNQQIVTMTSFSDVQFLNLMRKEYWEIMYPSQRGGIDWVAAKSEMMAQARRKGLFEQRNVRGSGVWFDDGRVVVNMGNHLLVDGVKFGLNDFKSRFFYTLGKALPDLGHLEPLSVDECDLLTQIADTFRWKNPSHGKLCAGLLVVSKICGALPVRPHAWLTGQSQSGKSTLMERLIFATLRSHSHYFLGGTSEAGIRQAIRGDAIPVIFDEFETTGQKSKENIQNCIELMRSAWSDSQGFIAKGSATGAVSLYQPRFSAIVSSIRTGLTNDADISRFVKLELANHGNDPEHWQRLDALLNRYNETYVDRLFLRSIGMIPTILENAKLLKSALATRISSRFGQQYGMLLAGYAALLTDDVLNAEQIDIVISGLSNLEEEREKALATDQEDCRNFLLTTKARLGDTDMTLGDGIRLAGAQYEFHEHLSTYGVAVEGNAIHVACGHTEIQKILRNTRWEHCLSDSLLRLPGAEKSRRRFSGVQLRCVKIPISD